MSTAEQVSDFFSAIPQRTQELFPGVIVAIIVAMTTITTPIGVNLAHKLNPSVLKRVFAAFLFLVALNMIRRAIMG